MQKQCFSAPFLENDGSFVDIPFMDIFVVGCIVTWLIELYAEARQYNLLKNEPLAEAKFQSLE